MSYSRLSSAALVVSFLAALTRAVVLQSRHVRQRHFLHSIWQRLCTTSVSQLQQGWELCRGSVFHNSAYWWAALLLITWMTSVNQLAFLWLAECHKLGSHTSESCSTRSLAAITTGANSAGPVKVARWSAFLQMHPMLLLQHTFLLVNITSPRPAHRSNPSYSKMEQLATPRVATYADALICTIIFADIRCLVGCGPWTEYAQNPHERSVSLDAKHAWQLHAHL